MVTLPWVGCDFQTLPTPSGWITTRLLGVMTAHIAVSRTCQASHGFGIWEGTQTVLHGVFLEPRWAADSFTASQSLPMLWGINQTVSGHCSLPQCAGGLEAEPRRLTCQTSVELLWLCDDSLPPSRKRDQLRPPELAAHTQWRTGRQTGWLQFDSNRIKQQNGWEQVTLVHLSSQSCQRWSCCGLIMSWQSYFQAPLYSLFLVCWLAYNLKRSSMIRK